MSFRCFYGKDLRKDALRLNIMILDYLRIFFENMNKI